jgi:hypothetical protein
MYFCLVCSLLLPNWIVVGVGFLGRLQILEEWFSVFERRRRFIRLVRSIFWGELLLRRVARRQLTARHDKDDVPDIRAWQIN